MNARGYYVKRARNADGEHAGFIGLFRPDGRLIDLQKEGNPMMIIRRFNEVIDADVPHYIRILYQRFRQGEAGLGQEET